MLIEKIKELLVVPFEFEKLTGGKEMYHFTRWGDDDSYFYYSFRSKNKIKTNTKRVFIRELQKLLNKGVRQGGFDRKDFKDCCPATNRDGGCGYCVMIRILEALKIAEYRRHGKGVKIIDPEKACNLLKK